MSEQINQNNPKLDEIAQADYNTTRMPGETDEQLIQRLHNIIDQREQTPKQPDECPDEYIDKGALYDTVWDFFEGKKSVSKKAVLELIDKAPAVPIQEENQQLKSELKILKDANQNLQDLYQKEKAKVEKAKQKLIEILKSLKTVKVEAYKEFAERLKERAKANEWNGTICGLDIDNLLKELGGAENG